VSRRAATAVGAVAATALAPCLATSISSRWATRKLFPVPALPVMNTFSPLSTTACIMAFCSAERFRTWLMQSEFASHSPRARDHELQRDASVRRRQCHAAPRRKLGASTAVASLPPGAHAHASAATILSNAGAPHKLFLACCAQTAANSHSACIAIRYVCMCVCMYVCMYFNSLLYCYISCLNATGHSDFYKCVCPVTRASS
jgi:hypothetical protein